MKTKYLSFGMGLLSITIVSRWSMGNAIFTAPSSLLPYGIMGPISFSIASIFSFSFLIPLILAVRKKHGNSSFNNILKSKLSKIAYNLFMLTLLIGSFASLIVISYSAAIVLSVLEIPFPIGCGLFIIAGFSVHFLPRFDKTSKIATIKVGLLFLTIIVLLINGYFIKGTESVYQGVRLYHPYTIYMNTSIVPTLIVSFTLAIFGHLISDRKTWEVLLLSNQQKLKSGLFTSGIILSTIPLSFTMITLASIQNSSFSTPISLFTQIFLIFNNNFLILMLLGIFIFILILSFSIQASTVFKVVSDLHVNNVKFTKVRFMLLTTVGVPLTLHIFQITLLDLFFIFGTFFAAVAPVIIWMLLAKRKIGAFPFAIAAGSTIFGWILMFLDYSPLHISVSFISTAIVMGGHYYFFEYRRGISVEG